MKNSSKQTSQQNSSPEEEVKVNDDETNSAPWRKAAARSIASYGTWFATEYPKLILQQQREQHKKSKHPLLEMWGIYQKTSPFNHLRGATSSAAQRGSSALIMFYGQYYILQALVTPQQHDNHNNNNINNAKTKITWYTAGLAGFLSGAVSSLIHTLFEPIKIRHEPLTWKVYRASLWPMMWRHALFDATFFATLTALEEHATTSSSYATQFGLSALAASTVNLTHDVWKTQAIGALPNRVKWMTVVRSLTVSSFRQQLAMKATDLGFNWWFTGVLYAFLFA